MPRTPPLNRRGDDSLDSSDYSEDSEYFGDSETSEDLELIISEEVSSESSEISEEGHIVAPLKVAEASKIPKFNNININKTNGKTLSLKRDKKNFHKWEGYTLKKIDPKKNIRTLTYAIQNAFVVRRSGRKVAVRAVVAMFDDFDTYLRVQKRKRYGFDSARVDSIDGDEFTVRVDDIYGCLKVTATLYELVPPSEKNWQKLAELRWGENVISPSVFKMR